MNKGMSGGGGGSYGDRGLGQKHPIEYVTHHYINIEFDPATWTKRIENGRTKWVSPPIALPAGWTTATAIITFDGMMAAITPIADDGVVALSSGT